MTFMLEPLAITVECKCLKMKRMDNLRPWLLRLSKADMLMPLCHLQTFQLLSSNADLLVFCLELNKMPHCQNLLESYTSMSSHFGSLNCIFLNTGWINSTLFKLFWHRNIQSSTLWCCQHRVWFFTQKGTSRWFVFERFSLFDFKYRNIYWIKGHRRQWAYPFQWIASRSRYALKKTSTWYAFEITCFYSG